MSTCYSLFYYIGGLNVQMKLFSFIKFTKFVICASVATFMISNKPDLGKME